MSNERPALPLRALVPNAITMLALCSGASGMRFAFEGAFEKAAAAIVIAGVLDGIDGRVARLLHGTSRFGAELDSLSDVIAFGVAPAFVMYLWALQDLGRVGWVVALAFAVACALRLARFNAELDREDRPKKELGFTTGVPAPAGAGMALMPLFWNLASDGMLDSQPGVRMLVAAAVTIVATFLMVSALPGWTFRSIRIPRSARFFALAFVGVFAAAATQVPWAMLFAVGLFYALTFPLASWQYARLRRRGDGAPPA